MKFQGVSKNGGIEMSDYTSKLFRDYLRKNEGMRLEITPLIPESNNMRRWYEGAIVGLVCFYQEGMDYRNWEDRRKIREWLSTEFCGEIVMVNGKTHKVAKSTKGQLKAFTERVLDWLIENYAPPAEALMVDKYKYWRDELFREHETYIDYLISLNILQKKVHKPVWRR